METSLKSAPSTLAHRVRLYTAALATDQTPVAFGLTPRALAGGMYDRLDAVDQGRVARVLDAAGVSL